MADWKNISINANLIHYDTGKATLIAMPHKSNYDGYKFWFLSKLVRSSHRIDAVSLGYTDEFTFRLFKDGKNRQRLDEVELTASEFEKEFETVSKNIDFWSKEEDIDIIHTPEHHDPIENPIADKELTDEF